jgi:hypothetical protein
MAGAAVYGLGVFGGIDVGIPPVVVALLASGLGMLLGGLVRSSREIRDDCRDRIATHLTGTSSRIIYLTRRTQ